MVALIEEEVERPLDSGKPGRDVCLVCEVEQPLRCREHLLGAPDAFLGGGVAAQERTRDLPHAEAAQDVEDQSDLGRLAQPGMAAGEHHAELIVLDRVRSEELLDDGGQRPFRFEHSPELGGKGAPGSLPPEHVEGAILGGRHEPGGRVRGQAAEWPHLQGAAEGVLHDVLGQPYIVNSEDPGEYGHHACRLVPE